MITVGLFSPNIVSVYSVTSATISFNTLP